ncbi:hypothetical protein Dimus_004340 [Dionaea muscipula]
MDEGEDGGNKPSHGSSQCTKIIPITDTVSPRTIENQYPRDEEDEEVLGGEDEGNGDEDEDEDEDGGNSKTTPVRGVEPLKKRKSRNLISSYEFAPRVPAAPSAPVTATVTAAAASMRTSAFGGRNTVSDWTEHGTFVLLDAWGDQFLKLGRKSLRSEEWQEVAQKVSRESKIERTDSQCRNRLDTLKKKYKKEKMRLVGASKWVYFKKMDMLMSSPPQQATAGLSTGLDSGSGEHVVPMKPSPRVHLNRAANGLDQKMMDSPGNSESYYKDEEEEEEEEEEEDSDGPLAKRKRNYGGKNGNGEVSSFKLLADSIQKFREIYEKMEKTKRQQMVELEKLRLDFQRELEMQRRQILERARADIAKIRNGDDKKENDVSNASG